MISQFKIFIADPDEKRVELYKASFKLHFLVDSAHDGLMSLRKIKLHKPHVILSAVNLPLLSGIGLLKSVRSHPELHARLFIILGREELPAALSLGANDFFDYDISPNEMISKIFYHIKINRYVQID
ncbi:MAG: response regulator [Candidatus Doudnabacteria bacterium]|nr:response regulator [Candidatus Doudnabacteria bacterium]